MLHSRGRFKLYRGSGSVKQMEDQTSTPVLALFVRIPLPGRVKTRLAAHLGDDAACSLYRSMVSDILRNIAACDFPIYLFHDGNELSQPPAEWVQACTRIIAQRGEDIGEKMAAAFADAFTDGFREVILLGSDIPGLDSRIIKAAAAALQSHDVVIAPAADGGYALIALQQESCRPALFADIPWSTDAVLRLTLDRCAKSELRAALLQVLHDIDTLDDLKAYCQEVAPQAVATNRFLEAAGYLSPKTLAAGPSGAPYREHERCN